MSGQTVEQWLKIHSMEQCKENFMDKCFDEMRHVHGITNQDLVDFGIDNLGHRKFVLKLVDRSSYPLEIVSWMHLNSLLISNFARNKAPKVPNVFGVGIDQSYKYQGGRRRKQKYIL